MYVYVSVALGYAFGRLGCLGCLGALFEGLKVAILCGSRCWTLEDDLPEWIEVSTLG